MKVALVTGAALPAKARLEEAWLAERFSGYRHYRRVRRRFSPGVV